MTPANVSTGINFAQDIALDKIPSCVHLKNAAVKFLSELEIQPDGYTFSRKHAAKALAFIQHLKHTKGHTAGNQFYLEPWQAFIIINLFGWVDQDGLRRFTKAYIAVPRKNGKSTLAAAVMLYFLCADGEPAAECYTAATKMEQAKIIWEEAYRMAQDSPIISDEIKYANSDRIKYLKYERSELKPLVSEDKTLDGLNPHAVALDEYHAHRNDNLFNVLLTGMGARRQPMMFTVTTAGFDRNSPALKYQRYCEKVLNGQVEDPNTFAAIWTIDQADDWADPSVWQKANPNWGVSVFPKKLHQDFREAQEMAHKEVEFKTKYLNIWTDSAVTWIPDAKWMAGAEPLPTDEELSQYPCYGGLDLGSTSDFNAFVRVWQGPEKIYVKPMFWLPEETIENRRDATGTQIRQWVQDGIIIPTPGNVTDYRYIVKHIMETINSAPIQSIAFDRWNATQPVAELMDSGVKMAPFGQGYGSMSAPTKEVERMAKKGAIIHGGNAVLRWMMGNVLLTKDPANNVKVDKAKSGDKVDGVVAMVMAIGEMMDAQLQDKEADFVVF